MVSNVCGRCKHVEAERKKDEEIRLALELGKRRAEELKEQQLAKQQIEEEARILALAKQQAEEEARQQALALELAQPKLIDCPDCGKAVSRRAAQCPNCGCPISEPKSVVMQPPAPKERVFEVVFRCVVQAVRDSGYAVGRVDKHNGMIAFQTGMSMWSFGQDIRLVVVDQGKTCSIDMTSRSGQITDWGESKRIGQTIYQRAKKLLAAEGLVNVLQ